MPSALDADPGFLAGLPVMAACQLEGVLLPDAWDVDSWAQDPVPLLAAIFPHAQEALAALPPVKARWGTADASPEGSERSRERLLVMDALPAGGLWVRVGPSQGARIQLRGFGLAMWPAGERHTAMRDATVASLVGWQCLRAMVASQGGDPPGWELYCARRRTYESFQALAEDCRKSMEGANDRTAAGLMSYIRTAQLYGSIVRSTIPGRD
jgi:hypothetical protein